MGTSTLVHECSNLDQLYNHMIKLFSFDKLIEFDYLKAMGSIYFKNKNFQLSIHYFERCLALSQTIVHSEEKDIAELYCSIAESHYRLRNYNQTINFYHKALNLNSLPSSKVIMPHSYLGFSYLTRADWSNVDDISSAKYHLQQVLYIDLENEILGDGKIIDIYQALGDINEYQNDPNSALDYYTQALELCESNQWTDDSNEFKEKIQAIKSHITESEQCKT
ncbi:unnamed protein product [Rotaria sp. Silwood2]|nr:unnamed protein product [Rotaria sp. Silwood2]CAF3560124.1 unnamed protein product [Rotaria sp. Silwood2]CAF4624502.1 unnamed protein product [Rotaria sp. Silwood2]CAF4816422.1 unnamed protein product [Rotaria sp. Silwood2]